MRALDLNLRHSSPIACCDARSQPLSDSPSAPPIVCLFTPRHYASLSLLRKGGIALTIRAGPEQICLTVSSSGQVGAQILDDGGNLKAFSRMDGASMPTIEIAQKKAYTALFSELCPKGIDVFFDNTGGTVLNEVLARINVRARIALCGVDIEIQPHRPGPGELLQPDGKAWAHGRLHGTSIIPSGSPKPLKPWAAGTEKASSC